MFKRVGTVFVVAGFALMTTGCGSGQLYDWGSYEQSVYRMYKNVDGFDVQEEIGRLSVHIEKTQAAGKLVPPGERLHVGYLCYLAGDRAAASGYFEAEKKAFPESTSFVNLLLERL